MSRGVWDAAASQCAHTEHPDRPGRAWAGAGGPSHMTLGRTPRTRRKVVSCQPSRHPQRPFCSELAGLPRCLGGQLRPRVNVPGRHVAPSTKRLRGPSHATRGDTAPGHRGLRLEWKCPQWPSSSNENPSLPFLC